MNGDYSFGDLVAGTYTVTVSAMGFAPQMATVTLANGQNATDNFVLS